MKPSDVSHRIHVLQNQAVRALQEAVSKAIQDHQRSGDRLAIWRDEKVAWVSADQLRRKGITKKLISIRLPVEMIQKLKELAVQKGDTGYQQLIKWYLDEAIHKDFLSISGTQGQEKRLADVVSIVESSALSAQWGFNPGESKGVA